MIEWILLFFVALIFIVFATIQDLRTQEVNDWLTYSLLVILLSIRLIFSIFSNDSFSFFWYGFLGLSITFFLGLFLYYARFFAGGDAKLLIALGPAIPLGESISVLARSFVLFLALFFIFGALYGFFWVGKLSFTHRRTLIPRVKYSFRLWKRVILGLGIIGIIFLISGILLSSRFFTPLFIPLGFLFFLLPSALIFAKALEMISMQKLVSVSNLRVGDWLINPIRLKNKKIMPTWDGLTQKELNLLKNYKKKVLIKTGIPFVPVFLLSFITYIFMVLFF